MRDKQLKFIAREIGIDASPLPDDAVKKLCQYALNAMALETPRFAAMDAKECGLKITLGK
jgi:hypothetical protein